MYKHMYAYAYVHTYIYLYVRTICQGHREDGHVQVRLCINIYTLMHMYIHTYYVHTYTYM
jgi:hypothetical protein